MERKKLKGAQEHSQSLQFCKHLEPKMEALTRMDLVVIEDYCDMTTMDENINWMTLAYLLSSLSLNLTAPLLYIYLYFIFLNRLFGYMHQRKTIPLPYGYYICTLRPQIIPLLILMLVHVSYEVSTPSPQGEGGSYSLSYQDGRVKLQPQLGQEKQDFPTLHSPIQDLGWQIPWKTCTIDHEVCSKCLKMARKDPQKFTQLSKTGFDIHTTS